MLNIKSEICRRSLTTRNLLVTNCNLIVFHQHDQDFFLGVATSNYCRSPRWKSNEGRRSLLYAKTYFHFISFDSEATRKNDILGDIIAIFQNACKIAITKLFHDKPKWSHTKKFLEYNQKSEEPLSFLFKYICANSS